MDRHAPRVADDHRADPEQLEADGAGLRAGHVGTGERDASDRLDQDIGQRRQDQAELVGPPFVARGAIGEQVELLFFDAVLHLAALAVEFLVELLSIALEIT